MTNLHKVAVIGLIALTASTSIASAMSVDVIDKLISTLPGKQATHGTTTVDCRVKGSDFWIMNFGSKPIDSGRQIAWSSPTTGDDGVLAMPGTLRPGEEVRLADILSDDAEAGSPCTAGVI